MGSSWPTLVAQGLKLPPMEVPIASRPLGKGISFHDLFSGALMRSLAEPATKAGKVPAVASGRAFVLLAEVWPGKSHEVFEPGTKKPAGAVSTLGHGILAPDPARQRILPGGA